MAMTVASPSVESLVNWQTCELACVPGVEGHACACVSKASRKGEHAASKGQSIASHQAKQQCMQ
jgi:hypothetical protein